MKLKEAIETIFEQNNDQTIWIKPGEGVTPETEVIIAFEKETGGPPQEANGYQYFLEVFNTQDLIIGLVGEEKIPNGEIINITNRVIYYAANDA